MIRILSWLRSLVAKDGDAEARTKQMLMPVCIFMFIIAGYASLMNVKIERGWMSVLGCALCALGPLVVVVGILTNVVSVRHLIDIFLVVNGVGFCVLDVNNAALSNNFRPWTFVVIAIDIALVFSRALVPTFIIPFVLVYLAAEHVESTYRYGLYDLGYWGTSPEQSWCNCASPPCATTGETAILNFLACCMVMLVDFHFTRGFAKGVRLQLKRVKSSVEVAAEIAAALARYDVDAAEHTLTEDLPNELKQSFLQLLTNLRMYKAYLPHSVLVQEPEIAVPDEDASSCGTFSRVNTGISASPANSELHRIESSHSMFSNVSGGSSRVGSLDSGVLGGSAVSAVKKLNYAARRARVSLAAGNMIGYLKTEDLAGVANAEWIASDVEAWCSAVADVKGVADLIGGDRRYASFNARQICGGHASAAVELLMSRGDGPWSGCVATGQAICGDFGSHSVLRFMVLGAVSSWLHPLERIAAQWRTKVLADGEAFSSSCYKWEGELLGAVLLHKCGPVPRRLYKMTTPVRHAHDTVDEEWMYQLGNMLEGRHAAANTAKEVLIKRRFDVISEVTTHSVNSQVTTAAAQGEEEVLWTVKEPGLFPS
eukprot:Hpha_TRINITY_DN15801_c4_g9::TRINITY_DN15801_c4_g9_i1::g.188230::m.188230